MNIIELRESGGNGLVVGTTCANCMYTQNQISANVDKQDLNKHGGTTPQTPTDLENAIAADVITMPGAKFPTKKHMCSNPRVMQWVTERMCCNLWDHEGVIRNFDGKEPTL
jgi:hypothetical protein